MRYRKEEVERAIEISESWANVCRKLGRNVSGGVQSNIKKFAINNNIDYSHFLGQAINRGKVLPKVDIEEYLNNKRNISSHSLRLKLIKLKIKKNECEVCHISEWNMEPVVLELDHIDSNHYNNELSNLQILCPNCHAQITRKRINDKKTVKLDKRTLRTERFETRKVKERPNIDLLIEQINKFGYSRTGRMYGVSDNCIRKWIKK